MAAIVRPARRKSPSLVMRCYLALHQSKTGIWLMTVCIGTPSRNFSKTCASCKKGKNVN
jgi:hypothetical protein